MGGGEGGGWDLIVPQRWGNAVFHALAMAGARVAGTAFRDVAALELLQPDDVADYPDTAAGATHWAEVAAEHRAHFNARPPAKRSNFDKLRVHDPFGVNWLALINGFAANHVCLPAMSPLLCDHSSSGGQMRSFAAGGARRPACEQFVRRRRVTYCVITGGRGMLE